MREKCINALNRHNTSLIGTGKLRDRIIDAMTELVNEEVSALQTKLNNERKMNESHVNTLLKQIEDKNKTNL
jgi:hypothetical protein